MSYLVFSNSVAAASFSCWIRDYSETPNILFSRLDTVNGMTAHQYCGMNTSSVDFVATFHGDTDFDALRNNVHSLRKNARVETSGYTSSWFQITSYRFSQDEGTNHKYHVSIAGAIRNG